VIDDPIAIGSPTACAVFIETPATEEEFFMYFSKNPSI